MFTVHTLDTSNDLESAAIASFDDYDAAVDYARSIATEPIYNTPDPYGVYVLIYDDDHDSPRYTSW